MSSDQVIFKNFAKTLEVTLQQYKSDPNLTLLETQREQIKTLISLETKLRKALISHPWGPGVYKKFVEYIVDTKRNILAARPYFRERQTTFTKTISGALKKRNYKTLYKFRVNYSFILFALKSCKWPKSGKIVKLAEEIWTLRQQITEQNMPLAISQARIFFSCTPRAHLTWMDMVQIHCGGLLIAVDKFVPPDTTGMTDNESLQAYRKFRAVAIGRMISDRLEQYSETVLHFYPVDRKKLYRANKIIRHFGDNVDYEKLAEIVNEGIELESQRTNAKEIANLLASASCVSGDTTVDETMETTLERFSVDEQDHFEPNLEKEQALNVMKRHIQELPNITTKVLKMKGISYDINVHNEQAGSSRAVPSQVGKANSNERRAGWSSTENRTYRT